MSSHPAYASTLPIQLWTVEVRAALIAWTIYSQAMRVLPRASSDRQPDDADLVGTVILALREWGVWLISTPIVFRLLSARQDGPDAAPTSTHKHKVTD